jgi:hypothetical protein
VYYLATLCIVNESFSDIFDSGKRHAKCIGKRIVAGKVIKESYGKEKQQHTFTVRLYATVIYLSYKFLWAFKKFNAFSNQ